MKPKTSQAAAMRGKWEPGRIGAPDFEGSGVSYFYNPEDWECTYTADQTDLLDEMVEDGAPGASCKVGTLIEGPTLFAMRIPTSFDEEGDAEDWETRLFASDADAEAAYAAALSLAHTEPSQGEK
jgi:hypothetical protein